MMKLEYLKDEPCPVCGARILYCYIRADRHVNKQQFETIVFACRGELEWSPNFSKEVWTKDCPTVAKNIFLREAAEALHSVLCHNDHVVPRPDVKCKWEHSNWDEPCIIRKRYLNRARSILDSYNGNVDEALKFLATFKIVTN